jgi:hypothetical protein
MLTAMGDRPAPWHVTARLEQLRGEERANALRVLGVAVFYAIEVVNRYGISAFGVELPRVDGVDASFHAMATALAAAWVALAAGIFIALKNRVFPPALKYVSTGADLFLLTAVLTLADGPRSPMLFAYFLVIALSGLRASRALVVFATVGSVAGYGWLLLDALARRPQLSVPPHWQITTAASIVLSGVVVGQIVSAMHRAAVSYAALERASQAPDEPSP